MAQGSVILPDDSANTGKHEDHFIIPNGNYREAIVIGDPGSNAAVAPVSATLGLGVNLLDGSDVTQGANADVAVVGDNSGTISAKLRGINKILADVWASSSHWLQVSIQNATLAVTQSGTWNIATVTAVTTVSTVSSVTAVAGTVNTSEVAPTTIFNGKTVVTTAGTRVTLASSQAVKSVTIKALATNTGIIYVGNTSVASTNGFQLSPGATVSLDFSNLNIVNLDASVNGEGVTYIAVN